MEIENIQQNKNKTYNDYYEIFNKKIDEQDSSSYDHDTHIPIFMHITEYFEAASDIEKDEIMDGICQALQKELSTRRYSNFLIHSLILLYKDTKIKNELFLSIIDQLKTFPYSHLAELYKVRFLDSAFQSDDTDERIDKLNTITDMFDFTPDEGVKFAQSLLFEQFRSFLDENDWDLLDNDEIMDLFTEDRVLIYHPTDKTVTITTFSDLPSGIFNIEKNMEYSYISRDMLTESDDTDEDHKTLFYVLMITSCFSYTEIDQLPKYFRENIKKNLDETLTCEEFMSNFNKRDIKEGQGDVSVLFAERKYELAENAKKIVNYQELWNKHTLIKMYQKLINKTAYKYYSYFYYDLLDEIK